MSELGGKTNLDDEHLDWVSGERLRIPYTVTLAYVTYRQTSSNVSSKSWNISVMQQRMPSNSTKQSPTIQLRFPSIQPSHKVFPSGEARRGLRPGRGKRLATMQTRYIISAFGKSFLLTYHHQAIDLDPLSLWGYEMKHAALHRGRDYDNAVVAFEMMLLKMTKSPDPDVQRELYPCSRDQRD